MPKITTFSRTFPGYHPRKGEPTHFVEKILNLRVPLWRHDAFYFPTLLELNRKKIQSGKLTPEQLNDFYNFLDKSITDTKGHTIRAGHRWEAGKFTTPAVWSGRPYHSPQIIFAPDIELKKVWNFEITEDMMLVNGLLIKSLYDLSANDGLSAVDFYEWFRFPSPFRGQIIAWDERINY